MEPLVSITEGEVAPISVEYFPLMLKLLILLVNLRQRIQAGTQIWPAKIIVMASKRTKNNININLESCVSVHVCQIFTHCFGLHKLFKYTSLASNFFPVNALCG